MSSTSSSLSKTTVTLVLITLLMVHECTANLATGRASLRPSAGKRSAAVLYGRTPGRYLRVNTNRMESELTCGVRTMSVLNARYQQLQEEIEEIIELMEACQSIRAANSL